VTLDEAIEHAKEVARTCDDSQCAADHMQIAEWLRQARGADAAARWYTKKIRELEEERDACSYEEGYADGFDRGEEAIIQQVDGIVSDEWKIQKDMVKAIKSLIKEFWKEREA